MTAYVPGVNETDLKKIVLSIQQLAAGRSNSTGTVTLTPSVATTTVTTTPPVTSPGTPVQSGVVAVGSTVHLTATTANAAAEVGNGTLYISAIAKDSFTITHASSATTGRTFFYAVYG
jgi:hypothetical protein